MSTRETSSRLLALFIEELDDRLREFDSDLLVLEARTDEGESADVVNRLFRGAHSLKGAASTVGATAIELVCHQLEDFLAALRDGTIELTPDHVDAMLRATGVLRTAGRALADGGAPPADISAMLERLTAAPAAPGEAAPPAPPTPPAAAAPPLSSAPVRDGSLRVPSEKIEALLEQSAELLVARLRVETLRARIDEAAQLARRIRPGDAQAVRELERSLERISTTAASGWLALEQAAEEIDAGLRELRMVEFATACQGLDRVARDVAKDCHKQVTLEIEGGETGLDRAIFDRLRDPLVHLVRNAVDHGIETPEQRAARGKPAQGTVRLGAALHGGQLEITVSDDGGGIDVPALQRRARERGIALGGDDEGTHLVFLPGLSTAATVTGRSGRGVGLDAVRAEIEALRGTVRVSSTPRVGTRFTLTLPFTLTRLRVVLFRCGGQVYAVNSAWVERFIRVAPERVTTVQGRPMLLTDGAPLALVSFAEVVGLDAERRDPPRFAIAIDALGKPLALAVDELLDERDLSFRPLGRRLRGARYVSGAAILGDGSLALVLRGTAIAQDAIAVAQRTRSAPLAAPEASAPRRVLLVDDSVTTRALERSILEAAGYDVVTAADGVKAWELLEGESVDVVVSDVDMPQMDGFALVETIRRSPRLRDLPIVLVTARESDADRQRGLDAGADAYIVKSGFRQEALIEAIGDLL